MIFIRNPLERPHSACKAKIFALVKEMPKSLRAGIESIWIRKDIECSKKAVRLLSVYSRKYL